MNLKNACILIDGEIVENIPSSPAGGDTYSPEKAAKWLKENGRAGEYCGHWILTAPDNHDIEFDYADFAHCPRITCHTCNPTLAYHPSMASSWERRKAEFLAEHPNEGSDE